MFTSVGGSGREKNSYSFGNSDKIQRCMQLPHLFREHFRTYNIPDTVLNSAEKRPVNIIPALKKLCSFIEKHQNKVFKNLKTKTLIFKNGICLIYHAGWGKEVKTVKLKKLFNQNDSVIPANHVQISCCQVQHLIAVLKY